MPDRHKKIAFGEALRAMSCHGRFDPDMTAGDPTGQLMERAYAVLLARQTPFCPEDFALYFLSRLLDRVAPRDRDRFRRGAARYLLENRRVLAREFRDMACEARGLLSGSAAKAGAATEPQRRDDARSLQGSVRIDLQDSFVFDFGGANESLALLLTQPVSVPKR